MDALTLVRTEVMRLPGAKQQAKLTFISCPFHAERTPSCRVNHDPANEAYVGSFRCYGCGTRGRWNQLAGMFGLRKLESSRYSHDVYDSELPLINVDLVEDKLAEKPESKNLILRDLDETTAKRMQLDQENGEYIWRGFPISFLQRVNTRTAYITYERSRFLYLPVNVLGKERGHVLARAHKVEDKTSYINKSGSWSRTHGLYLFDESIDLMRRSGLSTLVLVEGPRDALRLHRLGIPTAAILGVQAWCTQKATLAEYAGVKRIITCFDGDNAGICATYLTTKAQAPKNVKDLSEGFEPVPNLVTLKEIYDEVFIFPLWKKAPGKDPGNMPKSLILELRGWLA